MATPNFLSPETNPFGLTNVGGRSARPTWGDIDGDGDLDAFVGRSGGDTLYFQNTGTASSPSFAAAQTNPFGLTNVGRGSAPTLEDIDGDGDLDAFVGNKRDGILYFQNTGTASSPSFAAAQINPFGLTNVGFYSTPTFADLDGDGDLDALVGENDGNLNYFENTGSTSSPSFAAVQINPFGLNNLGAFSNPTLEDLDGDGDLDVFVGNFDGNTYYFENTGSSSSPSFAAAQTNPFGITDVGREIDPTFADLDGDGDLDALIGETNGDIFYLENGPVPPNQAPVAVDDTDTTDEDTVFTTGDVLDNDTDADNDTLTVASIDTTGTLGTVTDNGDGTFDYDPNGQFESLNDGETATDSFNYTVSDGNGGTDTATVTVTIDGVTDNTAPDAVDDTDTTDEDTVFTTGDVLDNDTDADNDTLTVASIDTTGTLGTVTDNGDGTFDYDPNGQFESLNNGETATDSFKYTVSDGNGGTDTATVTVTIDGVTDNTAPDAVDDTDTTDEDTVFTTGDVLDNDNDPDGDTLTVASIDTTGTLGTVTDNGDGTFDYDPNGQFESLNNGETATDSFKYTVSDGNGGTDTATVTVTIDGVTDNTAPDAVDDTDTTDEDTVFTTGDVLENDTDADNDTLTVTEVNGQSANVDNQITLTSGALLTVNSDGTYSYDPNGQFESLNDGDTDTDSFTYTVSDGNGGTDTATVTVTIDGVDEAPVIPPNSLESDYTIFTRNVSGIEYTVELANSQPVYTIDETATNQSLNDFLTDAVLELGGTVVRNGTINENSLEHFGGNQNPSITEKEAIDEVTIKIAGSGVGGQYKADFDNDADANAFQAFARDLLGKDPTKTKIFQFNGGTNGGSNNIRIFTNDEIVLLNSELSDGLRTTDSLDFKWSGADTSGIQVRNNFDDFIGEMGDLFGGDQLTNADIHVIPTLNEAELTGTEVEISNGIGDTETWDFNSEQEAQNFLTFFDSTVDAFAV